MSSLHLFSPSWLALLYPDIDGRLRLMLMFLSTKIRRNHLEINDNRRKICKPPILAYIIVGRMVYEVVEDVLKTKRRRMNR